MTLTALIVAGIGLAACLAALWGCHWLAKRMDRDDRKDTGDME